ncbi:hypothetical protein [Maritalea sp.]|uniref:hypothetical protein n=1 Tax=Maritalea sp. TaxID=2003361 RepID=UPI003EF81830
MQFQTDIESVHSGLFLAARSVLIDEMNFTETKKPRITTYADANGGICHMRTMPHGVDFGFLKGAKMQDELGRLVGKGKSMRVLPLKVLEPSVLQYYLAQAVELNIKK